jgi:hypothetical protein
MNGSGVGHVGPDARMLATRGGGCGGARAGQDGSAGRPTPSQQARQALASRSPNAASRSLGAPINEAAPFTAR